MARVEWSRLPGEEVEAAIGIMLCRENPRAVRRRPARGDKGVDVYIPHDGTWTIYQVKRFTGALTSSHKRQITKSFEEVHKYVKDESIEVSEWILIRPENPTETDEKWLDILTAKADFPCRWQGLDHCDRLAADNPSVVDYYFRDGRERLETSISAFMEAFDAIDRVGNLTEAAQAVSGLEAIHRTINTLDPHFRYDFAVQGVVDGKLPDPVDAPLLLAAVTRADPERAVTFSIFGRYAAATSDRPVPGHFKVEATPGSAEEKALKDFVEYGLPISGLGVSEMGFDLPGGLGGIHRSGTLSLGPAIAEALPQADLQLVVLGPDGVTEIASADIVGTSTTTGLVGSRFAVSGRERHGVFTVRIKVDVEDERLSIDVTVEEITGAEPADVLSGLQVMEGLRPPNYFALRLRNGPVLHPAEPVPRAIGEEWPQIIAICDALARIQQQTVLPIRVPDFGVLTIGEASEWLRAARLLRGEAVEMAWKRMAFVVDDEATRHRVDGDAFTMAFTRELNVSIAGQLVPLGQEVVQLMAARVDEATSTQDRIELIPHGDARAVSRWKSAE